MKDRLLNVQEAAGYLGVSPHTLNAWKSQKRIPYVKLGRRTVFDPEDLSRFIEDCKRHANPATKH